MMRGKQTAEINGNVAGKWGRMNDSFVEVFNSALVCLLDAFAVISLYLCECLCLFVNLLVTLIDQENGVCGGQ